MKHLRRIKIESKSVKKSGGKTPTLLWMFLASLLIVTVVFTIETATKGAELARLVKEGNRLKEENRSLSSRLLESSSLTALEKRAQDLGFLQPSKIIYVLEPSGVAKIP